MHGGISMMYSTKSCRSIPQGAAAQPRALLRNLFLLSALARGWIKKDAFSVVHEVVEVLNVQKQYSIAAGCKRKQTALLQEVSEKRNFKETRLVFAARDVLNSSRGSAFPSN